ncbi:helix-turn-helix domain-containing protein, partial [Eisenbergiella porci]
NARPQDKAEEDKANQYVIRAVEFIQRNYCNPVKVTDVADYVCINRSYLYTLFENSMGMSPQQFLTTYRITKAAELLAVTALPVESIALSCGYNDPLVFTKAFKQMKGMSPSSYRREMQNKESRRNKEYLRQVEDFISQVNKLNS